MISRESLQSLTAKERASLRANAIKALGGKKPDEAKQLLEWLDELELHNAQRPSVKIKWTNVREGHWIGYVEDTKRLELRMEENHTDDNSDVWGIYLDGKEVARARYSSEAKSIAEETANKRLAE